MSKLLENLRSLRNDVVRPFPECKGDVSGSTKWMGKSFKIRKKKTKSKKANESFVSWMSDVKVAVEDICGMGLDILDGTPWRELYREGTDPYEAAQWALEAAENEDDDEDEPGEEDESEELEERALSGPEYKSWTGKLNKMLKNKWGTTLDAARRAAKVTGPVLRSAFMNHTTVEMAARMIMQASALESEEDEEPRPSLRRRSYARPKPQVEEDVFSPLDSLMDEFRVRATPKAKVEPLEEVVQFMKDLGVPGGKQALESQPEVVPPDVSSATPPQSIPRVPTVVESMGGAFDAVQGIVAQERAEKEAFQESQRLKQKQDEDARPKPKKPKESDLGEASVLGGDFGRWGPATSAASASGAGLAAAVSKATGEKYKFISQGTPQSSEVGSDIWFSMEPADEEKPNYYLGIKIKGDKENPTWDVMLKKGMGLGSSSTLSSERGVETSGLKGAIGKLKGALKSKSKAKPKSKEGK